MTISFDKSHPLNAPRHPVMATIATAKFDATIQAYQSELGYERVDSGILDSDTAKHWGAPELAGTRLSILRPTSGAPVFFRFVEIETQRRSEKPLGWFALEICVSDVEALYERLLEGGVFTPFAKPRPLDFTDRVYPMQCKGPAGEILYLNQVRGSLPDIDLPIAGSDVDHLFIAILSAPDMEASINFYSDLLDVTANERHEIAYKTINRVHGLPLETQHKLATLGAPRHVGLEIDQYPSQSELPDLDSSEAIGEGILMVSFTVGNLDQLPNPGVDAAKRLRTAPYNNSSSVVVRGPGGERIELIEITEA